MKRFLACLFLLLDLSPSFAQFNGASGLSALNGQTFGLTTTRLKIISGGIGYALNDTLTLICPQISASNLVPATVTASSVSSGAITGITVTAPGTYTALPFTGDSGAVNGVCSFVQASTSGSGSGAVISTLLAFNATGGTGGTGNITNGSTPIIGATSGQYLYNNSSVVGFQTLTASQITGLGTGVPAALGNPTDTTGGLVTQNKTFQFGNYTSNRWYLPPWSQVVGGNAVSRVASTAYYQPILIFPPGGSFKQHQFYVNTTAVGQYYSAALYRASAGYPSTLIDSIPATQTNVSGNISVSLLNAPDFLAPGLYFMCDAASSAAPTFYGFAMSNMPSSIMGSVTNAITATTPEIGYSCVLGGSCNSGSTTWSSGISSYTWPANFSGAVWTPVTAANIMTAFALQAN